LDLVLVLNYFCLSDTSLTLTQNQRCSDRVEGGTIPRVPN